MNAYILALIALVAAFAVGFVVYGQLFKGPLNTVGEKIDPMHLTLTSILVYLSALGFIYVFDHFAINNMSTIGRGVVLGLIVGIGFFAFPLVADGGFLKSPKDAQIAVILNWVVSFFVVGAVVGWLR